MARASPPILASRGRPGGNRSDSSLRRALYRLATDKGELVIEADDPSIEVLVKQGGKQVTIIDTETKNRVELKAGKYELELSPEKRGAALRLSTDSFTLKRGDTTVVSVRRIPPQATPATLPRSTDKIVERTDQKPPVDPVVAKGRKKPITRGEEGSPAGAVQAAATSTVWKGWPKDAPPPAIAPFDAAQARGYQAAWARHLGVPVAYENSLGIKFVLIPAGEFMMGSTPAESEQALKADSVSENFAEWERFIRSESPRHKVILTNPIFLGVHEVRQKDYAAVMGKNPSFNASTGSDPRNCREGGWP